MSRQIDHMEHETFLREIRSLPFGNRVIAQRMGTDDTRISHYRNEKKWPGRKTLNIFNHEFRSDLEAIEKEQRIRERKVREQSGEQLLLVEEEYPFEVYQFNHICLIIYNIACIENSFSTIKRAIKALERMEYPRNKIA